MKLPYPFYVRILSPEHCAAVQTRLFAMGYHWCGANGTVVKYLGSKHISGYPDGRLMFSTLRDRDDSQVEFTLTDLLALQETQNTNQQETKMKLTSNSIIKVLSPDHLKAIAARLKELGYTWRGANPATTHATHTTETKWVTVYPNTKEMDYTQDETFNHGDRKLITLDDLYKQPTTIEVKLNSEYTAVVSKDGLKVGCQTFNLSVIDDLAKAKKEVTQ